MFQPNSKLPRDQHPYLQFIGVKRLGVYSKMRKKRNGENKRRERERERNNFCIVQKFGVSRENRCGEGGGIDRGGPVTIILFVLLVFPKLLLAVSFYGLNPATEAPVTARTSRHEILVR